MSIKGNSQKLFVGKEEANLISSLGNKKTFKYTNLKKIIYCFSSKLENGYLGFVDDFNHTTYFCFKNKENDKIHRTIIFIKEYSPNLRLEEHSINSSPYYKKAWFPPLATFAFVLLLICGMYVFITEKTTPTNDNAPDIIDTIPETLEPVQNSDPQTQAFSTTLYAGHYVVGIDIPVGTYDFFSKKGTGNLFSDDGTLNEIFDNEKSITGQQLKELGIEDFGVEELKNVYLAEGTVISVTGTQEISAGCSDGLVSEMKARDQDNLKEIELAYGLYAAGDDFPPGTYNIEWIEGSGNIQTDPLELDYGINEIMGDVSEEGNEVSNIIDKVLYLKKFNNLIIRENDILKIDEIKVKLTPSK